MALLWGVDGSEHRLQLGNQTSGILSRLQHQLDRDWRIDHSSTDYKLEFPAPGLNRYTRSSTVAMPWPTPTHIAISA